ncbi:unnamed protein product [Penicillium egyptiacum]|uniref:Uncharacterized protein n=1 Tax=Penicillium egyptiacum TaxID=1303716 RepID=A0A9W4KLT4_9EURO|nr:unnamed protein product [Penicillium egyptiacum]
MGSFSLSKGSQASIVKIAGAGFRLSLLLNAAACQLAQSRLEIHSIAKGISLFTLALKHVGQTIEDTDVDKSPEATEKAWEIAGQGQMIFIEIEHMLDKLKATDRDDYLMRIPLQERLKWCFRKQHVTYLLAQLESLKLSLIVMLQILQLGNVIKSNVNEGADTDSLTSTAEDAIAQEKAESQNMIIVRYWSVKRLDRLWDLVEQEISDASNDLTNQRISSNYSSNTASASKPLARRSDPTRFPIITLGDSDVGLSDMERSPKDMVQLSESTLNRLLSLWVPLIEPSKLHHARKGFSPSNTQVQPRVYVSSDTEEDDTEELDFDSHDIRGYYLEGSTMDWREPHSQEARQHAAELRRKYSSYQAHVESEPEPDEHLKHRDKTCSDSGVIDSSDESEQRSHTLRPSHSTNPLQGRRFHSNSLSSRYPPSHSSPDSRSPTYSSGSFPPPNHALPRPPPLPSHAQPGPPQQPYKYYPNQDYATAPRSIPTNMNQPNNPAITIPNTNPSPRVPSPNQVHFEPSRARKQAYNNIPKSNNKLQPRHHSSAYPLSSSSPESSFRAPPPRSNQWSPSSHPRRSSREEAKDRHKALTRNATRGLVGIGAIAGFMDALEAFSIL